MDATQVQPAHLTGGVDVRVPSAGTTLRFALLLALVVASGILTLTTLVPEPTVRGVATLSAVRTGR
ncbi:MAG: hypothetical protein ACRDQ5_23820 [Sciscionella sp.]